jgi:glucose-6-phosphate isomerase, archaeal
MSSAGDGGFSVSGVNGLRDLVPEILAHHVDPTTGAMSGATTSQRRLSDLRGCFADETAFEEALERGDYVVYAVASWSQDSGDGALSFGLGTIQPGRIGEEYHLTRGHYHAWRDAAEVYVGVHGAGGIVLQTEDGVERFVPVAAGEIVYVPGATAHRTVNTGDEPFVYLGVYPANAGHDYGSIADDNFRLVLIAGPDGPRAVKRTTYLSSLTIGPIQEAQE